MKNHIDVHKYLVIPSSGMSFGRDDINMLEYVRIVDWLTEFVSKPMQDYDPYLDGLKLARCGEGWSLHKMCPMESEDKSAKSFRWHAVIDDVNTAVMFKLTWP